MKRIYSKARMIKRKGKKSTPIQQEVKKPLLKIRFKDSLPEN